MGGAGVNGDEEDGEVDEAEENDGVREPALAEGRGKRVARAQDAGGDGTGERRGRKRRGRKDERRKRRGRKDGWEGG